MNTIGANIRALRTTCGISLAELSEKTGLSKGYLSELERGDAPNPTLDALRRVAEGLEATIADLVDAPRASPVLPSEVPNGLSEFARRRRQAGTPLEPNELTWLASARYRGKGPQTAEDFAFLFRSLRESTKKEDGEGNG